MQRIKITRFYMPPIKKARKKRSSKKFNLCPHCGNANCDPIHSMGNKFPAMLKIQKRLENGQCPGCGKIKKQCSCKSKM